MYRVAVVRGRVVRVGVSPRVPSFLAIVRRQLLLEWVQPFHVSSGLLLIPLSPEARSGILTNPFAEDGSNDDNIRRKSCGSLNHQSTKAP
jgi:hypothetical protein